MPFLAAIPAWVGMAAGLAGTGVSALSTFAGAQQQGAGLKAQAAGARYNQQVAGQNAQAVETAGDYQEKLLRERQNRMLGTLRANAGASGVTMAGSPLDVLAGNAADMEKDILANRYNNEVQAGRYGSQAGFYGLEAERDETMADYTAAAGWLGAGTTLLGGAMQVFGGATRPSFSGASSWPSYTGGL